MKTVIGFTEDPDSDDFECFEDGEVYLYCPGCNTLLHDVAGDPDENYGNFFLICDNCGFMGIELGDKIPTECVASFISDTTCLPEHILWYHCELVLFTHQEEHYTIKDFESDAFKVAEQKFMNGDYSWIEFDTPKYFLSFDQAHNSWLLTEKHGMFHFGFD